MPQRPLMSWNKSQKRWEAMFRGKRIWITARKLGCPPTEAESVDAANAWYLSQVETLKPVHPHQSRLDELARRKAYTVSKGMTDEAEQLDRESKRVETLPADADSVAVPFSFPQIDDEEWRSFLEMKMGREEAKKQELIWADRLSREEPVSTDRAVGSLAREYLATKIEKQQNGSRSSHAVDSMRRRLEVFTAWVGPQTAIDAVNGIAWSGWHGFLEGKVARGEFEVSTAQAYLVAAKGLLVWCYTDKEILESLPKNIDKFKFVQSPKKKLFFTADEVSQFINSSTGQLKLHLLLMANCGFTQGDIADLTKGEIDRGFRSITRKRGKTKRFGDVPTVTWALWPETAALLEKHLSDHPTLALTTRNGTPWVWERTDPTTGKLTKTDSINTIFRNMLKRTGLKARAGLRNFRSASSNLLDGHEKYRSLTEYWLGHSARSVKAKSYADNSNELLAAAVGWLRTQYKIDPA